MDRVAKGYEQICGIDFEEMYATAIEAATYRICSPSLTAHFSWHAIFMDAVTAFLNFGIDVTMYVQYRQLPTGRMLLRP